MIIKLILNKLAPQGLLAVQIWKTQQTFKSSYNFLSKSSDLTLITSSGPAYLFLVVRAPLQVPAVEIWCSSSFVLTNTKRFHHMTENVWDNFVRFC